MCVIAGISERESLEGSSDSRLDTWETAIWMFVDRPLFGIGLHNFTDNHFAYSTTYHPFWENPHATHNTYLEALSETGLFGFVPFIAMVFLAIRGAIRMHRDAKHGSQELVDITKRAALPCICAYFTSAFFLSHAFHSDFVIVNAYIASSLRAMELD